MGQIQGVLNDVSKSMDINVDELMDMYSRENGPDSEGVANAQVQKLKGDQGTKLMQAMLRCYLLTAEAKLEGNFGVRDRHVGM